MAHALAIQKASLAASLLRPDPTSVPRDEISTLHTLLDSALSHCSPANIQRCKDWLLEYVVCSANRVGGFARFVVALGGDTPTPTTDTSGLKDANAPVTGRTSLKRKRLHMLYLFNDLFHHTKYHSSSTAAFSTLSGSLQAHFVELLSFAAAYDREKHPKHHRRLSELLDIWQEHGYFGSEYISKLREVVANAAVSGPIAKPAPGAETAEPDRKARDGPYVMPSTHGDPSTPYYDLPAGNMIPHIIPNSTIPLRPDMIKPIQFLAGPADEKLVSTLKVFLTDVDRIYGPGELDSRDGIVDIDELGEPVVRDEITGDILEGETYYGWSRSFCQQMKKRNARGQSQSRSRSRSRSLPKRRRYSSASDDSRYTRSRSPRRERRYSRSPSRSRSRSYSPAPAPAQSQSQPQSYQQPPPPPPQFNQYNHPQPSFGYNHAHPHSHPQQQPPPPPPIPYPGPGTGPGPAFRPPPQNFHGAWPPPPQLPQYSNYPPQFPQMQMPGPPGQPPMPPGLPGYGYPHGPGGNGNGNGNGRGWQSNQHPPPPPGPGRGRR